MRAAAFCAILFFCPVGIVGMSSLIGLGTLRWHNFEHTSSPIQIEHSNKIFSTRSH